MKKVVINTCFGGFSLSEKAYEFLGLVWNKDYDYGIAFSEEDKRDDPRLIECIEQLGHEADGYCANLEVVEYDDYNYDYSINDYDGLEALCLSPKVHRSKLNYMTINDISEYLVSLGITVVD